ILGCQTMTSALDSEILSRAFGGRSPVGPRISEVGAWNIRGPLALWQRNGVRGTIDLCCAYSRIRTAYTARPRLRFVSLVSFQKERGCSCRRSPTATHLMPLLLKKRCNLPRNG